MAGFAGTAGNGTMFGGAATSGTAGTAATAGFGGTGGQGGSGAVAGESGAGGGAGDGNESLETASTEWGQGQQLIPPETDVDYFVFEGKKGDWVRIIVDVPRSEPMDWTDTSWIDPALKVFNSQGEQIAYNDDGLPRVSTDSDLLTRLPADGTYYAQVSSFCVANGGTDCPTKMNTGYSIFRHHVFGSLPYIYETEPNEDPNTIESTTFDFDSQGGWFWTTELASFSSEQDVDYFRFVLPSVTPPDIFADSYSLAAIFPPNGPNGNVRRRPWGM